MNAERAVVRDAPALEPELPGPVPETVNWQQEQATLRGHRPV